jgi:hypothetical protein
MPTPAEYARHFHIPELKNKCYLDCFKEGRKARLTAESAKRVPLHSHDKTRQSLFTKGWQSVSDIDLLRHQQKQKEQAHGN